MQNTKEQNRQIQEGMVEAPTLFDSDLEEYEWMQEQKAKAEAEANLKTE